MQKIVDIVTRPKNKRQMHHLPLLLLTLISFAGFGQQLPSELPRSEYTLEVKTTTKKVVPSDKAAIYLHELNMECKCSQCVDVKPDTLRAYILVTMCRKCAAEPMPGYVVIEQGKRPIYLNRCKKALKTPQVGWGYELVNPNKLKQ